MPATVERPIQCTVCWAFFRGKTRRLCYDGKVRCPKCTSTHRLTYGRSYNKIRPKRDWSIIMRGSKYGLKPQQLDTLFNIQKGACAICTKTLSEGRGTHIDHCHKTNRVRGLLCLNCNIILGHAKDSPIVLMEAAKYLLRTTNSKENA